MRKKAVISLPFSINFFELPHSNVFRRVYKMNDLIKKFY